MVPVSTVSAPARPIAFARKVAPGLGLAVLLAVIGTLIGRVVPLVGSAVPGIVLGAVIGAFLTTRGRLAPGLGFASKRVLQASVVLLGTQLSLGQAVRVGAEALPVMLGTLVICLIAAVLLGRLLGTPGDTTTLIGVGTGICGASAIAATAPVIGAAAADVAYAVSTIFLFNVVAVILFPIVGHLLGMSQASFGLFAGTAVNDTSSVVAAATTYGHAAANHAVVVKLVRTLAIIPITLGLAALVRRRETAAGAGEARRRSVLDVVRLVPWFLVGFVVAALVRTVGLIPTAAQPGFAAVSTFLIAVALSAIGLSTDLPALRRAGWRPLALGGLLWVVVSASSLGLQALTGTL